MTMYRPVLTNTCCFEGSRTDIFTTSLRVPVRGCTDATGKAMVSSLAYAKSRMDEQPTAPAGDTLRGMHMLEYMHTQCGMRSRRAIGETTSKATYAKGRATVLLTTANWRHGGTESATGQHPRLPLVHERVNDPGAAVRVVLALLQLAVPRRQHTAAPPR
jgi:hypothetical protein